MKTTSRIPYWTAIGLLLLASGCQKKASHHVVDAKAIYFTVSKSVGERLASIADITLPTEMSGACQDVDIYFETKLSLLDVEPPTRLILLGPSRASMAAQLETFTSRMMGTRLPLSRAAKHYQESVTGFNNASISKPKPAPVDLNKTLETEFTSGAPALLVLEGGDPESETIRKLTARLQKWAGDNKLPITIFARGKASKKNELQEKFCETIAAKAMPADGKKSKAPLAADVTLAVLDVKALAPFVDANGNASISLAPPDNKSENKPAPPAETASAPRETTNSKGKGRNSPSIPTTVETHPSTAAKPQPVITNTNAANENSAEPLTPPYQIYPLPKK